MRKPNFFLVGGAKCGTTSLAYWLSKHPNVYMPRLKEPDYFYPNGKTKHLSDYEDLFKAAKSEHLAVGEASVRYLFSKTALKAIKEYSPPDTKFIVIVRNPIEMAESLHAQRLYSANESIKNFESAWRAQSYRKSPGFKWPKQWYTPEVNLYGDFCKIGSQTNTLIDLVGRDRVLVLLLDDFRGNPRKEWLKLQNFLNIPDDGRTSFQVLNERKNVKSHAIQKLYNRFSVLRARVGMSRPFVFGAFLKRLNTPATRPQGTTSQALRKELQTYFKNEVAALEKITERDLSHWE